MNLQREDEEKNEGIVDRQKQTKRGWSYVLNTRTGRLSTQTVTQRHGIGFVPLLHSHVQRWLQHTARPHGFLT
jgi:putative hemolysin